MSCVVNTQPYSLTPFTILQWVSLHRINTFNTNASSIFKIMLLILFGLSHWVATISSGFFSKGVSTSMSLPGHITFDGIVALSKNARILRTLL